MEQVVRLHMLSVRAAQQELLQVQMEELVALQRLQMQLLHQVVVQD